MHVDTYYSTMFIKKTKGDDYENHEKSFIRRNDYASIIN